MVKDKETTSKKYKSVLSLGKSDMVKLNMSFEELAKRAVKVEVKKKDKPKEDKSNNTKDVDNN